GKVGACRASACANRLPLVARQHPWRWHHAGMPESKSAEAAQAPEEPRAGATSPSAPWQEPPRGGYPSPRHFAQPGADQLRAILSGRVPAPPISRLTGMRLSEVGDARAAFQMPATGWLVASQGRSSIGPLTMVADAAVA